MVKGWSFYLNESQTHRFNVPFNNAKTYKIFFSHYLAHIKNILYIISGMSMYWLRIKNASLKNTVNCNLPKPVVYWVHAAFCYITVDFAKDTSQDGD